MEQFSILNPQFKLIHNQENLGFVKNCNKGVELSQGEIIVLLNSDTKVPSSFCEKIIECFDKNPNVGIASPIGSYTGSYFIPLLENMTLEEMNKRLKKSHICSYPIIPKAEGFCFCIRREVINNIKYLDEIFGKGYGEECDYSCRARQNGYEIVLIDNLYVYHKRHASFGEKNREKLFSHNKLILESRWDNFLNNFFKQTNWKNPIAKIKQDLFAKKIWLISYYYQPEETFLKFCDFKIFRIKRRKTPDGIISRWIILGIRIFKTVKN